MTTPDGRFTITFNGEIYNFAELRKDLEQRGARFSTRSDTEVILQAYAAGGPACFANLRGMFALAIWDAAERTAIVARDRFGIKPFYFHASSGRLVFASEVKALTASGLVPHQFDPDAMYGYFRTGSVPEPRTLLRDVRCLEAGHYATWKNGSLTSQPYWTLRFGADPVRDAATLTRTALLDSVSHHFVSDTPVGLFLSGGLDSTALAALSTLSGQRDLRTFSIAFPGVPDDEGELARRTAAHFKTTHAEWAIDATAARSLFAGFLAAADQPTIDGLNVYAVSKFARESGLKVVLSGLGGDELFGGYKSFTAVPELVEWRKVLRLATPLCRVAGRALDELAPSPRAKRVGDWLDQPPSLTAAYEMFRGIFTRREARTLVEHYAGDAPAASPAPATSPADATPRDAVSRLELTRYMKNQLLRDADTMSMAWGLELRVPFLDGPLVDAVTALPARTRLRPGKRLLLDAVPEIPTWIRTQPKRGFLFPMQQWMDGEWRDLFDDVSRRSPVTTATWYRAWCLFMLDRWRDRLERRHG
jgi:asparagine synthase (glutamine-hydrolysing)